MVNATDRVAQLLREASWLIGEIGRSAMEKAGKILLKCYRRKGRVFTLGDGRSASTAPNFALFGDALEGLAIGTTYYDLSVFADEHPPENSKSDGVYAS